MTDTYKKQYSIDQLQEIVRNQRVFFAILNWGMGHATRSSALIERLLPFTNKIIVGSDGRALKFLTQKFPELDFVELPGYGITYPSKNMVFNAAVNFPQARYAMWKENKITQKTVRKHSIDLIISDSRFGCYHTYIPSYIISHQLSIFHAFTPFNFFANLLNTKWLSKFYEVWVPDSSDQKLSGDLSNKSNDNLNVAFIGPQSLIKKMTMAKTFDVLVLLSGPEPQRSVLADLLFNSLINSDLSVVFVEGKKNHPQRSLRENQQYFDFVAGESLEKLFNTARLVVCRSGYSTLMDLHAISQKAIIIPTPGQSEQEFLSAYHDSKSTLWKELIQSDINLKLVKTISEVINKKLK